MNTHEIILSFSESQFARMTERPSPDDDKEIMCDAVAFRYPSSRGTTILARNVMKPSADNVRCGSAYVEPSPAHICAVYNACQIAGATDLIQFHDHYFSEYPDFSGIDNQGARCMQENIVRINPAIRLSQIVFGRGMRHFKARLIDRQRGFVPIHCIEIVGPSGIRRLSDETPEAGEKDGESENMQDIDARNEALLGSHGMAKIRATNITIIGGGGLGSACAYHWVRQGGNRHITIIDFDKIDATNCNRFYGVLSPKHAIGRKKADYIVACLRRFCPTGHFKAINDSILSDNPDMLEAVKQADIIFLCVDDDATRAVTCNLAARYGKPVLNVANAIYLGTDKSIQHAYVSVQWFFPREPRFPCLTCQGGLNLKAVAEGLMPKRLKEMRKAAGYIVGTEQSPAPQVIPINSTAAGIAVWEAALWRTGLRQPSPWIHFDMMNYRLEQIQSHQNEECQTCGNNRFGCLGTGDADLDFQIEPPVTAKPKKLVGLLKDLKKWFQSVR